MVGIFFDFSDTLIAVLFINFLGVAGAGSVGAQEDHDLPNRALFIPALFELANFFFAKPLDFIESVWVFIDNFERIGAEAVDDFFGEYRADPFNEARFKIFLDAEDV